MGSVDVSRISNDHDHDYSHDHHHDAALLRAVYDALPPPDTVSNIVSDTVPTSRRINSPTRHRPRIIAQVCAQQQQQQ